MSKATILLIDDDALVLQSLKKALQAHGYDVITAGGFEPAMKLICHEKIDLILSDIRMPERNGVDTVKQIQKCLIDNNKKDLPVIFITGYSGEDVRLQAPLIGETLYKPIDLAKLLTTIQDYL